MKRTIIVLCLLATAACSQGGSPTTPSPPTTPQAVHLTFSLSGHVSESEPTTDVALGNVRVEFLDGANVGRQTTTDAGGAYTIAGLEQGGFSVRASKAGYDSRTVGVTLTSNLLQTFALLPTFHVVTQTVTRQMSGGDPVCYVSEPCQIVPLIIHHPGRLDATLSWTNLDDAYLVLQLYSPDERRVIADDGAPDFRTPKATISVNLSQPGRYELRSAALRVSRIIPITFKTSHPN